MNCRDFIKCLCLMLWIATSAVSQEIGIAPEGQGDRYTVKDEKFSVRLPLHPSMTTTRVPRKTDGKLRLQRRLRTASGGLYFGIDAFENPKPKQSLEEFIAEVGLTGEYEYDPATKRSVTVDGFPGIEYSSSNKTVASVVQFFATEKHLYRFVVSGPGAPGYALLIFNSIDLGKKPEGLAILDGPGTPVQPPPNTGEKTYIGKEVDVKARLLSQPEPRYTEDARKNKISGVVVLKAVFAKTGYVENIRVVSGLPYGLTEQAIASARKIKFTPAMKDGKPVSMWMQLEYNFDPSR